MRKDGQEIHLTGLEYGLLDYLSAHANRICPRWEILDHVWGTRFQYDTGTIDVNFENYASEGTFYIFIAGKRNACAS